ncbi:hypothetical protein M601_005415 [Cellulophaga baltica 4]|nr:hypothetical protein M601_005415 [Cellulophaga baltica 4]
MVTITPKLVPSKNTSILLFASAVPENTKVLSDVMASEALLPLSSEIVVTAGALGGYSIYRYSKIWRNKTR